MHNFSFLYILNLLYFRNNLPAFKVPNMYIASQIIVYILFQLYHYHYNHFICIIIIASANPKDNK